MQFRRVYNEEQFGEIILNLDKKLRIRCRFKYFLSRAMADLMFDRAESVMSGSRT